MHATLSDFALADLPILKKRLIYKVIGRVDRIDSNIESKILKF